MNTARIAINNQDRRVARLLHRAEIRQQQENVARFNLQHAQTASWLAGHPADMQDAIRRCYDEHQAAMHRTDTARMIAARAVRQGSPTGRRPLWGNVSKPIVVASAMAKRASQLWTVRIGFQAARPKTRQPSRRSIFSCVWQ